MSKLNKFLAKASVSLLVVGYLSVANPLNSKAEEQFIDYQPFVTNYLAAMLAEYDNNLKQAAVFYEKAGIALAGDIGLKERSLLMYLSNGNTDKAYEIAKEIVNVKGVSPITKLLTVIYDVKSADYKTAYKKVSDLHKALPGVLQFHLAEAYLDIKLGKDVEKVIEDLKNTKYNKLLDGHKFYHIGRMYEKAGKIDKAIQAFSKAFDEDKGSIFNVIELGRLYEQNNKRAMARDVYRIFQETNPESMLLKSTYTRFLNKELPAKKSPATIQDDIAEVLFGFSTLMVSQNLDSAGRQLLYMTVKMNPNHDFAKFYEGVLNEQVGDLQAAVKSYEGVTKNNPAWMSSQVRIIRALKRMNKTKKSLKKLESLLKQNPQELFLQKTAAEMYYTLKDYKKAVEYYTKVINSEKNMTKGMKSIYYFARGASYERLGNFDKASQDLEKSLEANPNNPTVMNYLGYMWIDLDKKIDEAFAHIQKAMLLRPNDGSIVDSMGWAYYKKADYNSAIRLLERAVELMPDDPTINMHLGDVYEKLGRLDEARLQWKRALELGPDSKQHKKHIENKLKTVKTAKK